MSLLLIWRHSLHYVIGDHGCDEGDHERWLTLVLKVQHHARIDESEWNRDQPGSHVPPVDALPQVPLFFPVYRHLTPPIIRAMASRHTAISEMASINCHPVIVHQSQRLPQSG